MKCNLIMISFKCLSPLHHAPSYSVACIKLTQCSAACIQLVFTQCCSFQASRGPIRVLRKQIRVTGNTQLCTDKIVATNKHKGDAKDEERSKRWKRVQKIAHHHRRRTIALKLLNRSHAGNKELAPGRKEPGSTRCAGENYPLSEEELEPTGDVDADEKGTR